MKWEKRGFIFKPDGSQEWARTHAQVPVVESIDSRTLRIYYGARDEKNRTLISYIEVDADNPSRVTYQHEAPLVPLGRAGFFDDSGVMPSDIVSFGSKKYLYYVGWNTGNTSRYRTAIGLAVSSDGGRTFSKIAKGPVMDRIMTDPVSISCQSVMREEGVWKTWYMSYTGWEEVNGVMEPFYEIKYAESPDGIHWKRDNISCITLMENEGGVACPTVLKEDGGYKMWYSTRGRGDYRADKNQSYRIGYAESDDGINWIRKDDENQLLLSESGWDSEMIAYPYVIRVKGRLLMFYNGNGFGKSGLGYAELIDE